MKTRDIVSLAAYVILGLAMVFTAGVQIYAGQPWRESPRFWLGFFGFMCWDLLPYILLTNQVRWLCKRDGHALTISLLLVTGVIITAYAVWTVVQAFFIHPSSTSGIVLVIVPGGQLLVSFIAIALAMLVNAALCRKTKMNSNQQRAAPYSEPATRFPQG